MALRAVRDADGDIWEEREGGVFRTTYEDGSYREETSFALLDLWWGPLAEVAQQ